MTAAITPAAVDTAKIDQILRALPRAASLVKGGLTYATEKPGTYLVTASDGVRQYVTSASTCTCQGFTFHGHCKHQLAVIIRTLATA